MKFFARVFCKIWRIKHTENFIRNNWQLTLVLFVREKNWELLTILQIMFICLLFLSWNIEYSSWDKFHSKNVLIKKKVNETFKANAANGLASLQKHTVKAWFFSRLKMIFK